MKKQLFNVLLIGLLAMPAISTRADVVDEGQSTEGNDFWVTFLQADQKTSKNGELGNYNKLILQLSISAREDCDVTIENPFTTYSETVHVTANEVKLVDLYEGHPVTTNARTDMATTGKVCYAVNSEKVDTCALHVTVANGKKISLFAANYKKATFDATNVLPSASLLEEYVIQSYTPSDHDGNGQGTHFAIIATEDTTIVEYVPTVNTKGISEFLTQYNSWGDQVFDIYPQYERFRHFHAIGDTILSDTLMAGQVYYVWTGEGEGDAYDLSGTYIKSNKPIAVFQGSPHTNIPYEEEQRDHIVSQAMPTQYWGNTFVLTASASRPSDIVRIMALNDETEVRINGTLVHTFDFTQDTKHFWEFEIGTNGTYAKDGSCLVETSCPCAVHLFIVSQKYHTKTDGDPAMLWINPIEQQIDQVTFATYKSRNGTTSHYVNVVTDQPALMTLDSTDISAQFKAVSGSSTYHYAQISLGNNAESHTLMSNGSNFIAHVYGFTANESCGYSAGGATKPLTQYITINGEIFTPDSKNTLCGEDTVRFACHPDYEYDSVYWYFGDGEDRMLTYAEAQIDTVIPHYYAESKTYDAYVLIYRESSNLCKGQNAIDSIPITVTIGRYQFTVGKAIIPCPEDGKAYIGKIPYTNPGQVDLHGDNVKITFDSIAKVDGFKDSELVIKEDHFQISIPDDADPEKEYGIRLIITSDCGGADTTLTFSVNFDNDILIQRYSYLLGLKSSFLEGHQLSDFQWYRYPDSTKVEGQTTSNLNFYELPTGSVKPGDAFYLMFYKDNETIPQYSCPKAFDTNAQAPDFGTPDELVITASYAWQGDKIFVNADWNGKTDIECYAQWINVSGDVYQDMKFNIPDGGCTISVPSENGFYILRVTTDGKKRSFKFIINQ